MEAADEAAAEEARAAAAAKGLAVEADGVKLLCSEESPTGYLGVTQEEVEAKEVEAKEAESPVVVLRRSARLQARTYDTAVEAAVAYATRAEGEEAGARRARGGGRAAAPRRQRRRPDAASGDGPAAG